MEMQQTMKRLESKLSWVLLVGVVITAVFLLYLAPEEKTLGAGIRAVYVHVALIWTGLAGLVVAGLLGLALLLTGQPRLAAWLPTVGWVGFAFYAAGVIMSAVASKVNWGNIFWQEPRMMVALNNLALTLIVLATNIWLPWPRLRGLFHALLPLVIVWFTRRAPLVLHPQNPIFSSDALGIQLAFLGLFGLTAVVAAWIVWWLKSARRVVEGGD
jgi:hypothetical protein